MYRSFLALRFLRSRLVNFIAVGGVMFGVAVLIVVTSVMDGFREKVLTVIRGNLSDVLMTPLHPPGEPLPDYLVMDELLRQDERVEATSPQVETIVFYLYPARTRGVPAVEGHAIFQMRAVGIDYEREKAVSQIESYVIAANDPERPFFSQRQEDYYKEGTVLVSRTFAEKFLGASLSSSVELPRDEVVLETYGDLLGIEPEEGETLEDYARRLEAALARDPFADVIERDLGITFANLGESGAGGEPGGPEGSVTASWNTYQLPISAVYDGEDTSMDVGRLYLDIATLRRLGQIEDPYHAIRVRLQDPQLARQVQADFTNRFPDFLTTTWADQRVDFLRAVNNEKVLLAIVLSFIVLLGGFIILATLTLTVVEKTRDIGVLSALGATRRGVLTLFLANGLLIGVVGAALGVVLGWWFTSNVNAVKDFLQDAMGIQIFPSDIYLFREIPTIWSWGSIAWVVGGSLVMAFVAGFIPALRAARMDPVRALRYE